MLEIIKKFTKAVLFQKFWKISKKAFAGFVDNKIDFAVPAKIFDFGHLF